MDLLPRLARFLEVVAVVVVVVVVVEVDGSSFTAIERVRFLDFDMLVGWGRAAAVSRAVPDLVVLVLVAVVVSVARAKFANALLNEDDGLKFISSSSTSLSSLNSLSSDA